MLLLGPARIPGRARNLKALGDLIQGEEELSQEARVGLLHRHKDLPEFPLSVLFEKKERLRDAQKGR
jgi:hypothetical protein